MEHLTKKNIRKKKERKNSTGLILKDAPSRIPQWRRWHFFDDDDFVVVLFSPFWARIDNVAESIIENRFKLSGIDSLPPLIQSSWTG